MQNKKIIKYKELTQPKVQYTGSGGGVMGGAETNGST